MDVEVNKVSNRAQTTFPKLKENMDKFVEYVAITAFVAILVIISLQVIFRYVLVIPVSWTEELARWITVWLTFLGAAIVTRKKLNVRMEYIVSKLPESLQVISIIIADIAGLMFMIPVLIGSVKMMIITWTVYAASMPWLKMAYVYLGVTTGSTLMILYLLISMIENSVLLIKRRAR